MFPPTLFTLNDFAWAMSIILSRSYALSAADGSAVTVLVPMLDMLNHGPVQTRFGVTDAEGIFHIVARDPFSKGAEVCVWALFCFCVFMSVDIFV